MVPLAEPVSSVMKQYQPFCGSFFKMIDLKVVWTRYETPSPDGPYQDWFDVDSILLKPNYDFLHSD